MMDPHESDYEQIGSHRHHHKHHHRKHHRKDYYENAIRRGMRPYPYRVNVSNDAWLSDVGCFFIFFGLLFLAAILLLVLLPYGTPPSHYRVTMYEYNNKHSAAAMRDQPRAIRHPIQHEHRSDSNTQSTPECTEDETFDDALSLCVPRVKFPSAMDQALLNVDAMPCDDFYEMSCGAWIASHEDASRAFSSMFQLNQHMVADLIRDAEKYPAVNNFYRSCVDTLYYGLHDRHTDHHRRFLMTSIVDPVFTHGDLSTMFARLITAGLVAPFSISIENHPRQARMVPMIRKDGFFTLNKDRDFDDVVRIFTKAGNPSSADRKARLLFSILRKIYGDDLSKRQVISDFMEYIQSPSGLSRDLGSWSDFQDTFESNNRGFSFYQLLEALGGRGMVFDADQEVWVLDRDYFDSFNIFSLTIPEWRVFGEFSVLVGVADFFPDLEEDVYFESHIPGGSRDFGRIRRRWHWAANDSTDPDGGDPNEKGVTLGDCIHITHKMLPGLVSHAFSRSSILATSDYQRVTKMVQSIRDEFANLLDSTTWIDPATKRRAKDKIQAIRVRVGHPQSEFWPEEPFANQITADRYARNVGLVRRYRVRRDLDLWRNSGTWFDLDEIARFGAPLSTVNAYYSPTTNSIVVFSGIMRFPFYHPRFDDTSMYAALGVVVGHELSHSMDPFGSQFDRSGSYRQWWRHPSRVELANRLECVAEEYTAPDYCGHVEDYGNKTLGEDTADLIGVRLAFRAWYKKASKEYESYTQEQLAQAMPLIDQARHWFIIYAQSWCASYSREMACQRVTGDVHPLPRMRVTETLRNLQEFRDVFSCSEGHQMVHEPRCVVYGD